MSTEDDNIRRYMKGKLLPHELEAFHERLEKDPMLAQKVKAYRDATIRGEIDPDLLEEISEFRKGGFSQEEEDFLKELQEENETPSPPSFWTKKQFWVFVLLLVFLNLYLLFLYFWNQHE